jgi:hypothetical protein
MAVFYPEMVEEVINIDRENTERRRENQKKIWKEVTTETLMKYMAEGLTTEEIQKKIKKPDNCITREQFMEYSHQFDVRRNRLLNAILMKLMDDNKDDFIFNHGREQKLNDHWTWDKAEKERFVQGKTKNYYALQSIKKELGLNIKLSAHVARHTATQFTLDSGASNHEVSEYLSHNNLATMEKYRQTLGTNSGELANRLSTYLKPARRSFDDEHKVLGFIDGK